MNDVHFYGGVMFEPLISQQRALFAASFQVALTLTDCNEAEKFHNRLEHAKPEKLKIGINQPEQS